MDLAEVRGRAPGQEVLRAAQQRLHWFPGRQLFAPLRSPGGRQHRLRIGGNVRP